MSLNIIHQTATHKIESAGTKYIPTQADKELAWSNEELARTDKLVMLPDYPEDLLAYRALLMAYPDSPGYPNAPRPSAPDTRIQHRRNSKR